MCSTSALVGSKTEAAWAGRAEIGSGWARFLGQAGDNHAHRHHAVQIAIGEGSTVGASIEGERFQAPGLLIGADVLHALQPGPTWLLYVERESQLGRRLDGTCKAGVRMLTAHTCQVIRRLWQSSGDPEQCVLAVVRELTGDANEGSPTVGLPSRIQAVITTLPGRISQTTGVAALAAECNVSPSRFAHVFKAQTGMAVRPYLRWLRLARALEVASAGQSLTDAAHAAGFADAAHFSRTMRRHFGITPIAILRSLLGRQDSRYVQVRRWAQWSN